MGGHFPSLSYAHTLKLVPELDSVVRFEGEATLLELVDHLSAGHDWRDVAGLFYSGDGAIRLTPPQPLVNDLDYLPYLERDAGRATTILGRRAMPLLASRRCIRTCSFCSIHVFYRTAPGKVVRTCRPLEVVEEMRHLSSSRESLSCSFRMTTFPSSGRYGNAGRASS